MYTVKIATDKEFEKSRDAWNSLAALMPIPSIFCTWEWIYTWWEQFGGNYKPLILFVYEDSELKGILPLASYNICLSRECTVGRVLTYCGCRELYPDHLDVIASKENAKVCIEALCNFLHSEYREWDVLDLRLFAEGSNFITWAKQDRAEYSNGLCFNVRQDSYAYFIPLHGNFEDFVNTLDSKQRYNLKSRKKKLEAQGFLYESCDPLAKPEAFDTLFAIHANRSSRKKIRSTFNDAAIIEFHKALSKRINNSGWISMRFLRNEKDVIAASYNFNYQGRIFSYQKGMDAKWERFGPGKAIVFEAIKEAFQNGNTEYNFLQGSEEYKSGWTKDGRPLFTVTLYNKTINGMISNILYRIKCSAKKLFRSAGLPNQTAYVAKKS